MRNSLFGTDYHGDFQQRDNNNVSKEPINNVIARSSLTLDPQIPEACGSRITLLHASYTIA